MKDSILKDKRILAVDDEPDVLEVLKEEIIMAVPMCIVDTATSYDMAAEFLASWTYDLAIFDIMGVRGFDLLRIAINRDYPIPVVMLTAHALSPEFLRESIEKGAEHIFPNRVWGRRSFP